MILTVTINPLLERRLQYPKIVLGEAQRNPQLSYKAGGKGINVSRQLLSLGVESSAFTFTGGNNGKLLRRLLEHESIDYNYVRLESETREAIIAIDDEKKQATSYFMPDCEVSIKEVEEFRVRLDKMIQNCEIVVLSGSSPCLAADTIFPFAIELANRYDKISFLDTYGRHLSACYDAGPTVVHNNVSEVELSLGLSLKSDQAKLDFLTGLNNQRIKQCYLTDGAKSFFSSNFNFHFKTSIPKINHVDSTGCGDAFTAGIVYGWYKDLVYREGLKLGTALGILNAATLEVCKVLLTSAEQLMNKVLIEPIGNKIKEIDDTPGELV